MKALLLGLVIIMLAACTYDKTENINLELVFSDSNYELTGVAVSKTGRLFTNYPDWNGPHKYALVEILPVTRAVPYPNDSMNSWKNGDNGMNKWICVQAVSIDDADNMWVVDPASPKQKGVYQNSQKLVEINIDANTVERTYPLNDVTDDKSYINDVRVDTATQFAYLSNSSEGGIVVVDLKTGKARQVLQGSPSVIADKSYDLEIDNKEVQKNDTAFRSNSDGIALTCDGKYLYYKPLTDDKLYRIQTAYLKDATLTPAQLNTKVENLGSFCTTDGMACDKKGNVYLGDLENHRIVAISPDLQMTTLIKDDKLEWPDSYQLTDDGYLYVSCSEIDKQPAYNNGIDKRTNPYAIYRIKLPK
jgi:sugar lactone lactonase YvrE